MGESIWLIAQFGCRGKIFHEKDRLSQFLPRKQVLEGPKKKCFLSSWGSEFHSWVEKLKSNDSEHSMDVKGLQ